MIYLDTSAFVKLRSITIEFLAADRKLVNVAKKKRIASNKCGRRRIEISQAILRVPG